MTQEYSEVVASQISSFERIYKNLQSLESGKTLEPLLIGKNSIQYYDIYKEMIARKLALPPKYVTSILSNPLTSKKEVEFVISGLVS